MITMIPDEEYDEYILQLASLTPRQQKRWKKTLTHRTGKTTLRFKNGKLVDFTDHGEQTVACIHTMAQSTEAVQNGSTLESILAIMGFRA